MDQYLDWNNDKNFDYKDIFDFIKDCVRIQTKNKMLDGTGKKTNVKNELKNVIGNDIYDRYAPMIDVSIDFIYSEFFQKKIKCFKCL